MYFCEHIIFSQSVHARESCGDSRILMIIVNNAFLRKSSNDFDFLSIMIF